MWSFLKKIGWRIAGIYFWTKLFAWLFGFGIQIISLESYLFQELANFLSSIGASPVDSRFLPFVIKTGWVLFVTEFRPLYILGFFSYIIIFPVSFIFYISFKIYKFFNSESKVEQNLNEEKITEPASSQKSNKSNPSRYPLLLVIGFLLLSWFLLFGDARSVPISSIGAILSACLFLILAFRLFTKAKPLIDEKPSIFSWLEFPAKMANNFYKQVEKKKYETKDDLSSDISQLKSLRKILIIILKFINSSRFEANIPLIVLFEFIFTLIIVATSAVLFWGLAIKTVNPAILDLPNCFYASLSYFLPGLEPPDLPISIPFWIKVGNSATSWILFVLYLSPAGNLIPDKQKSYGQNLSLVQKFYKQSLFNVKQEFKGLNILAKKLPKQISQTKIN